MTESIKCSECGESLDKSLDLSTGEHLPCPHCGSTRRIIEASIIEQVVVSDHFSMLGKRKGKSFTFGESQRPDGRASSADYDDDRSMSFSVSGSSPQGEEETLKVCKLLVQKLNLDGNNWCEPVLGNGVVDCETTDINDPSQSLQFQVIRAISNQSFWKQLNTQGAAQESSVDPSVLASYIENAIKKKTEKLPSSVRNGLILVLDATLLPGITFDVVFEEFHTLYSTWASSLGFEGIWLVGPVIELVQRLDQLNSNGSQEEL